MNLPNQDTQVVTMTQQKMVDCSTTSTYFMPSWEETILHRYPQFRHDYRGKQANTEHRPQFREACECGAKCDEDSNVVEAQLVRLA